MDLVDSHSRKFVYLRLSVTDRCNFRCAYCLPNGYEPLKANEPMAAELSQSEIRRLVQGFVRLGVLKVRLTGGEPTVRRDIVEIAHTVASVPGIKKVALTTNGNRLFELAAPLRLAGVTSVNVSIDSLNAERFHKITGMNRLADVLKGVDQALAVGFEQVKVNAVLLKGTHAEELNQFMEWVKNKPVSVRFIELMQTGKNGHYFNQNHLSGGAIQFQLQRLGWRPLDRAVSDGPALEFFHPESVGRIGIIAPYSKDFCNSCNRLRVTSRGALKLCLFGNSEQSLRPLLQVNAHESEHESIETLAKYIQSLVIEKPKAHFLKEGNYGNTANLSGIGG